VVLVDDLKTPIPSRELNLRSEVGGVVLARSLDRYFAGFSYRPRRVRPPTRVYTSTVI
jgi:hypothetical protein